MPPCVMSAMSTHKDSSARSLAGGDTLVAGAWSQPCVNVVWQKWKVKEVFGSSAGGKDTQEIWIMLPVVFSMSSPASNNASSAHLWQEMAALDMLARQMAKCGPTPSEAASLYQSFFS